MTMTKHLGGDELVDLAEGIRARHSAPHLDACDACRRQFAELRTAMSAAAAFEVPEPSPIFWDHLAERVREAVRAEGVPEPGSGFGAFAWRRCAYPLAGGALAGLVMAAMLTVGDGDPRVPASGQIGAASSPPVAAEAMADDPSLTLVAGLTADMDLDTARAAGLTADGSAEHAVTDLNDLELRELQRLLRTALARPGA